MRVRSAILLPALTLAVAGAEARPDPAPWPAVRAFTSRDGLPQNSAMGLARDGKGRLWVATQDGAAVFNGRTWRTLNLPDRQVSNFLRCVAVGEDDALWFGRQEGGLARWDGQAWRTWLPAQLEGATRVNALATQGPDLWIGTHGQGLLRMRDGQLTGHWLPSAQVRDLTRLGPSLWIGSSLGLHRLQDDALEAVPLPPGVSAGPVAGEDARLWMASPQGLWRREQGRWLAEALPAGWRDVSCVALTRDVGGKPRLWVGSPVAGLARREPDGRWLGLDARAGLPGLMVTSLLPGVEDGGTRRLWVGLNEGVVRVELGRWSRYGEAQGLPALSVYGLGEGREGSLWLGTRNGLWEQRGGRTTVSLRGSTVNAVLETSQGEAWAALGDGLARREGGQWRRQALPEAMAGNAFRRLYEIDGDLWTLGSHAGLVRRHDGRWEPWGREHGFPSGALHSLLQTREGLWVGTESNGLHRWQGGRWTRFDRTNGLPNNTVMDLRELTGPDGRRWLLAATESGGLAYAELGLAALTWRVLAEDTTPALPNNTVYQAQVDAKGRVYCFTNRGVARVTWGPGPDPVQRVETFTTEDGLPSLEFNGGASFRDARGRIWGGTVAGAAVFDPALEVGPGLAPSLVFERLTSGATSLLPGATLTHREARLEAFFAAVDLFRGEEVQYRTQLEGVEDQPGPWTLDPHRSYGSVPAGSHLLKVWARDALSREVGPVAFPFTVKPAPWRTGWAYGLYLLGLAGGVGAVFHYRIGALRRRNEALEAKVVERTREVASQRDQIANLMASLAGSQRDVKGWARAATDDLARSLGSGPIGVFILEGEDLRPLRALEGTPNPSLMTLSHPPAGLQVVRVQGPSGVLQGALLMSESLSLRTEERDLLAGFASQLGAVLELQRTQEALRAARARGPLPASEDGELRLCPLCRRAFAAPLTHCPEDGETLDDHLRLPYRIQGRYELRDLLGEGGMGLVFEVEDLRLHRRVALKVLRPELMTSQARARFLQEAHALAAIHDPGVIGVFDSGEWEGGSVFLVMERLLGNPLSSLLKAHGAGHPHQVAHLLRQGAAALQAAHRVGLLHRDLKPANLFLASSEVPFRTVLLDFGLAKSLEVSSAMTQTGMVIGTPQYMSPEQAMGKDLDARSDAYSFAVVIYEALTGRRLVPFENVGEAFLTIVRGGHEPPSAVNPLLGPEVDRLVMKGLAPDPEDRPLHLGAWAEALATCLEALPAGGPAWPLGEEPGADHPDTHPTRPLPQA